MSKWTHPQGLAALIAGVYAALSPIWTTHPEGNKALYTMITLGVITAVLALISLASPGRIAFEGLVALMGVLFVASPWVMGFSTGFTAYAWTAWIVGAVTCRRRGPAGDSHGAPWFGNPLGRGPAEEEGYSMARVRTAMPARARALVPEGSVSPSGDSSSVGEVAGSGQARERILDAAEDLFAADGFDATPTSRIARRAAVAKGLLFYYFPRKMDLLRALFAERLPVHPLSSIAGVVVKGDMAGSLVRLADRAGLTGHHWQVLSAILFREAGTHPDVREHLRGLYAALMELTESVLAAASPRKSDPGQRKAAAGTFVAVLLHQANSQRFDGLAPDLGATAEIVSGALLAQLD